MGDSRLLVYFDGGARANGTAFAVAGAGAVVYRDGVKVAEVVLPLPTVRSNNVAEYEGLLAGLHLLGDAGEAEGEECTVRGDSALVVGHLARRMACSEELKPYLTRAALKVSSLQRRLTLHIEHVAREQNTDADALSNAAMDLVQRQRPTRQQQETMLANFRRSGLGKALSLIEMGKAYGKVVAQPWFCGHEYSTTVLTSVGGTVVRVPALEEKIEAEAMVTKWGVEFSMQQQTADRGPPGGHRAQHPNATQSERHAWLTERYHELFEACGETLRLHRRKVRTLGDLIRANDAYEPRAAAALASVAAGLDALEAGYQRLTLCCEGDADKLKRELDAARRKDREAAARHAAWVAESDGRVRDNQRQQDACWEKLFAVEKDLQRLGRERSDEVRQRVDHVVGERCRQKAFAELVSAADYHALLLQQQVKVNQHAARVAAFVRDSVGVDVNKAVSVLRRKESEKLREEQLEAQQRELALYRSLHAHVRDLILKKEIYRARMETGMRASWQLEKLHRSVYDSLALEIEGLRDIQMKATADFEPSEASLRRAGVQFVHPVSEDDEEMRNKLREALLHEEATTARNLQTLRLERALASKHTALNAGDDPVCHPFSVPPTLASAVSYALSPLGPGDCNVVGAAVLDMQRLLACDPTEKELQRIIEAHPPPTLAAAAARHHLRPRPPPEGLCGDGRNGARSV
ncbi:69 kDa paraflagellar rod protein [Diplonema papillatum]|nr:69 kDa paraflagellar rod protein [Diplonema papillatum]